MKEESANNSAKKRYSLSSYYNEHEDQGMHSCICGCTIEDGSIGEVLGEFIKEFEDFQKEFDLDLGEVTTVEEGGKVFIDWHEKGNDRCFGFEIEEL